MTAAELIKELQQLNPKTDIIISVGHGYVNGVRDVAWHTINALSMPGIVNAPLLLHTGEYDDRCRIN